MHVLEAALIANATNGAAAADHPQPIGQDSLRPARLLVRAFAGLAVLGLTVALLDAAAPAQLPILTDATVIAVR